jgi:cobalt-zinc-cadmium efflux system outer membrane protein
MLRVLVSLLVLSVLPRAAEAAAGGVLDLSQMPSDADLTSALWQHAPDLVDSRTQIEKQAAALQKSHLWPNPTLDLSANTLPIGATTPSDLDHPLSNVPNYATAISELIEIGKRDPRQRVAAAALETAVHEGRDALRTHWSDLLDKIGAVGGAEIRVAALTDLVSDADRLAEVETKRTGQGDIAALDADRAKLDAERLHSNLVQERQALRTALLECSRTVGLPCEPFGDPAKVASFIAAHVALARTVTSPEQRPDLQALQSRTVGAQAALDLAHAQAIPDPTLRFGYTYDNFVAAGNQRNSVFVGVSLPLPIFDHGQADAREALAELDGARQARARLLAQALTDTDTLRGQVDALVERRRELRERTVPLAQSVVEQLQRSVNAGGSTLQDLLTARRTLGDLLLDAADADHAALSAAAELSRAAGVTPQFPGELDVPTNGG